MLSKVALDYRVAFLGSDATPVFLSLPLVEPLNIRIGIEDTPGNGASYLYLREDTPVLIEVLEDAPILAVDRSQLAVGIQSLNKRMPVPGVCRVGSVSRLLSLTPTI